MRGSGLCVLGFLLGVTGCAAEAADAPPDEIAEVGGADQTSGAGGAKGTGGRAGSGGATSTAGAPGSGGATSTGGATRTGGAAGTGGATGIGGAIGTGGSAGTDGGPPHVVGACDGLGAVDHFEDITPPGADLSGNGVTDVAVDPIHAGTLYVGTDKRGIFKSTNCGANWVKTNTGRNGSILDSGTAWMVLLDPDHPEVLYSNALYGSDSSLFKSKNGGVDWDSLFPPGSEIANKVQYTFFQFAAFDPTDHQHLLVTFHANCKDPASTNPAAPYDSMCLAETTDAGDTWRLFKVNPTGGGWVEGAGPLMFGRTNWGLGTWMDGVYSTSDSGGTWKKAGPGNCGLPYLARDGSYYTGSYYGVERVTADGRTWTQVPGSPNTFGIIGDGTRIFASQRDTDKGQPYFTSLESNPSTWTPFSSPNMAHGAVHMVYDPDHHVLYSANTSAGLWRMVTQ